MIAVFTMVSTVYNTNLRCVLDIMVTISAVPGCRDWRNADVFVAPQNPDVCGATAKGSDRRMNTEVRKFKK